MAVFIIDDDTVEKLEDYQTIMSLIRQDDVDVSNPDSGFQSAFCSYYFPSPVNEDFKKKFFTYMEECRTSIPEYGDALLELNKRTDRVDYSFVSKLLHSLDDSLPILDQHVMRLLGFRLMLTGRAAKRIAY